MTETPYIYKFRFLIIITIAKNPITQNLVRECNPVAPHQYHARGKSTCKSNLFGSYKGDLNKDLREGKEQVNVKWQIVNKYPGRFDTEVL